MTLAGQDSFARICPPRQPGAGAGATLGEPESMVTGGGGGREPATERAFNYARPEQRHRLPPHPPAPHLVCAAGRLAPAGRIVPMSFGRASRPERGAGVRFGAHLHWRCAPTALAQHASAVQVSAVPVGVAPRPAPAPSRGANGRRLLDRKDIARWHGGEKNALAQARASVAPLRRLERRHLPPEGSALSTELQGHVRSFYRAPPERTSPRIHLTGRNDACQKKVIGDQ